MPEAATRPAERSHEDRPIRADPDVGAEGAHRVLTTVLFSDIVGSSEVAAAVGDQAWRRLLDHHDEVVRRSLAGFGGREVKSLGDGFLAVFDAPTRAVRCAQALTETLAGVGLEIRVGLHTGELELRGDDICGLAVHIGARIAGLAGSGEVLVSRTVKELATGSDIEFIERGEHVLAGIRSSWPLFAANPTAAWLTVSEPGPD